LGGFLQVNTQVKNCAKVTKGRGSIGSRSPQFAGTLQQKKKRKAAMGDIYCPPIQTSASTDTWNFFFSGVLSAQKIVGQD